MSGPRPTRRRSRRPATEQAAEPQAAEPQTSALDVLNNRPFLLLWLSQLATQVGGNMVIYGLTVLISATYGSATATSFLLLSFLVPAVVFSAVAGVLVDEVDKRVMLVVTNVVRGVAFVGIYFFGGNLALLYLLVIFVATTTTFFGPAEASMIPTVVPREQLLAANSFYTLTMNAAFAVGFALFGPFVVILTGPQGLILVVAALYFVAAGFCWTLPPAPPPEAGLSAGQAVHDAEQAVQSMVAQFAEGIDYIRKHHAIGWSLSYLGITGALIGVLGVLGPIFARTNLGLAPKDFVVIVLPLGIGVVTGILGLNTFGRYLTRRRVIEVGMIALGVLLSILAVSAPIARFLERKATSNGLQDVNGLVSVLAIVIGIAFLAGVAYSIVAISSQTQLQEDLPEDVRGRVFGVLNMLVSIASLLPIIIVGPLGDLVGTTGVILASAILIGLWGVASVVTRGPLQPLEHAAHAVAMAGSATVDPFTGMSSDMNPHAHRQAAPNTAGQETRRTGGTTSSGPKTERGTAGAPGKAAAPAAPQPVKADPGSPVRVADVDPATTPVDPPGPAGPFAAGPVEPPHRAARPRPARGSDDDRAAGEDTRSGEFRSPDESVSRNGRVVARDAGDALAPPAAGGPRVPTTTAQALPWDWASADPTAAPAGEAPAGDAPSGEAPAGDAPSGQPPASDPGAAARPRRDGRGPVDPAASRAQAGHSDDAAGRQWRLPGPGRLPRGVVRTPAVGRPSGHSLGEELRRLRETFRRRGDEGTRR